MPRYPKAERERRQLEQVAYHEAGHAVIALSLGRAVRYATIIPNPETGSLGHIVNTKRPESIRPDLRQDRRTLAWIDREVTILLAGPTAEGILRGRRNHVGASSDYRRMIDIASHVYGLDEVLTKWVDFKVASTRTQVSCSLHWVQIEAVAASLVEHKRLTGKQLREVCRTAIDSDRLEQLRREEMVREDAKRVRDLEAYDRDQARKGRPPRPSVAAIGA